MPQRRLLIVALFGLACSVAAVASAQSDNESAGKSISIHGIAEFRQGDSLIVDGYRVSAAPALRVEGKPPIAWNAIELGYDVEADGVVQADGSILADTITAKPRVHFDRGSGAVSGALAQEGKWLSGGGSIFKAALDSGSPESRLPKADPQYERVKGILERIAPSYIEEPLRLHLVNSPDWNARGLPNGSIAVAGGLLKDMDDDEVAIVLGHELAHITHEHAQKTLADAERRKAITEFLTDVAPGGAIAKVALTVGGLVALKAWQSGYSRSLEAEADRVGLSYAAAGGYDVRKAPEVWTRFQEKYGNENFMKNALVGEHPRNSARSKNAARELQARYVNYEPNTTMPKALATILPGVAQPIVPEGKPATVGAVPAIGKAAAAIISGTGGTQLVSGNMPAPPVPSKEITVGMTETQVREILGNPKDAVSFKAAAGTQSKWVYDHVTVVFANGRVKTVEF